MHQNRQNLLVNCHIERFLTFFFNYSYIEKYVQFCAVLGSSSLFFFCSFGNMLTWAGARIYSVHTYGKSELCKNHEFSNKLIQLMKRRTTRDKSRKKSNETCLLFIDVAKNDLLALKFGTNVVVVMIYLSSPRTKQTT